MPSASEWTPSADWHATAVNGSVDPAAASQGGEGAEGPESAEGAEVQGRFRGSVGEHRLHLNLGRISALLLDLPPHAHAHCAPQRGRAAEMKA